MIMIFGQFLLDSFWTSVGATQALVHLGQLLFPILIRDIDARVRYVGHQFWWGHKAIKETGDSVHLQSEIDSVYRRADENNMMYNSLKFNFMSYSHFDISSNVYQIQNLFMLNT